LKKAFVLQSDRLGFRNWTANDLPEFTAINSDPAVMEHFPNPLTEFETLALMERLQDHYHQYGYNYYATEVLSTGELIGFIGLANQEYISNFTPAVDIGWRLKKSAWGKGYATEGARRCLEFAFHHLHLERVISICTANNIKSENVMKKIGMTKIGEFEHPKLIEYPEYQKCLCYAIDKKEPKNMRSIRLR